MDKRSCGMIVKVENLTLCRRFYRDILALGEPVTDSNFLCEFSCGDGYSLILEKAEWEYCPRERESRCAPVFPAEDLKAFAARLAQYGYAPEEPEKDHLGIRLMKCRDPEGNAFFVTEKRTARQP